MPVLNGNYDKKKKTIKDIVKPFCLQKYQILTIVERIEIAFSKGLSGDHDTYLYSPLKMLPTHVTAVPDGTERGRFVAIDLGGTNLRVLEISVVEEKLKPSFICFTVPKLIMTGEGEALFDFIANCMDESFETFGLKGTTINYLGFTFSFPCNQLALNSATLIRWTKGYSATGVVGQDVVALLRKACQKKGLPINDYILINDTTGTLLCGGFENRNAKIGVIMGTGTNACYLENGNKVRNWINSKFHRGVIINTEWATFGENGELKDYYTHFDSVIDKTSINPDKQIFEKMISGMYLGKLVKLILLEAAQNNLIFKKGIPIKLMEEESFDTSMISASYAKDEFLKQFFQQFDYNLDDEEFQCVWKVCEAISLRSAHLCAAGLIALLKRIECPKGVIAADGSMFRKHPMFVSYIEDTLKAIIPERQYEIIIVDDGSGKGAALAASIASNINKNSSFF
ncbi:hypothetical protein HZS_8005 [Henneguya salminicola]|nr:hypothetical protein HZS_8005 [Henneguya salminicola]